MFSKTIIIGRLGQSPRFSTAKSGTSVCSFSVAVDDGYGDKKRTEWFAVTVFGKTAENCNNFLAKGSLVSVIGTVHLHTYQGKDGGTKSNLELVGDSVTFLSSRQEREAAQAQVQPQPQQYDHFTDVPSYTADGLAPVNTQDGFAGEVVQNEELPF